MLFWILAAIMASAVTAALMFPLYRGRAATVALSGAHEMEVYRDQLAEIDRDLGAGLIGSEEAEVARAEIGRRLLAASRQNENERAGIERADIGHAGSGAALSAAPRAWPRFARHPLTIFLAAMPVLAIAGYVALGSPGTGQQPLSARLSADPAQSDIGVLVANAERHLAENPDDGRGWDVLAPIYLRSGRIEDAENAYRKAIHLLGPSAARQAGLGEALVTKTGGIVTEEARLVFQSARELDTANPRPAYFLALAQAQEGKITEARKAFEALIARSPPDAPWIPAIRQQIARLDRASANGLPVLEATEDAVDTAPERQMDIRARAGSLEARLAKNPNNIDGWLTLVRTRAALGDLPSAQAALNTASATFPSGAEAVALTALAGELGLKATSGLGGVSLADQVPDAAPRPAGRTLPAGAAVAAPFIMPSNAAAPGNPSAADIAAAQSMSAEDRQAMIRSMVESLDAKLTDEPNNIEGWLRLVRSYSVLGETDAARSALTRGRAAFAEDSDEARALASLAEELALETGRSPQ